MEPSTEETELALLRRHYLRKLPEAEARRVAQRILTDDAFDDLADRAADALVTEFRDGVLAPGERLVVSGLLTYPEWRRRLEMVEDLRHLATRTPAAGVSANVAGSARMRRTPTWLGVAAALVAVFGLSMWQVERQRAGRLGNALERRVDSLRTQLDSSRGVLDRLRAAMAPQQTVDWALSPFNVRASDTTRVLRGGDGFVRLQLFVDGAIPRGRLMVSVGALDSYLLNAAVPDSAVRRSESLVEVVVARGVLPRGAHPVTLYLQGRGAIPDTLATYVLRIGAP